MMKISLRKEKRIEKTKMANSSSFPSFNSFLSNTKSMSLEIWIFFQKIFLSKYSRISLKQFTSEKKKKNEIFLTRAK